MMRLQRRTTFQATGLVAFALVASAFGFFWYYLQAISVSARGRSSEWASAAELAEYGTVWLKVYLASGLAGLVLCAVAAKGARIKCFLVLAAVGASAPFFARLALELLGA